MTETETDRKAPRGPFTPEEEARVEELYRTGEYSSRDLAREFNSNPSKILKILASRQVPLRPPGPSEIQKRNTKRAAGERKEARKRQAEIAMAQEIAAARRRERVNAKADQLNLTERQQQLLEAAEDTGSVWLAQEALSSVALDGETHVVGEVQPGPEVTVSEAQQAARTLGGHLEFSVEQADDEPRTEIRWRPREGEHIAHAQTIAERVHQVDELLADAGFFSGRTEHGHLVWQPGPSNVGKTFFPQPPVPDLGSFVEEEPKVEEARAQGYLLAQEEQAQARRADYTEQALEELSAEHRAELDRVHAWSKEQWAAGVRHGYESATNGVADLLRECIKETAGHAAEALTEFLEMLEDGEHFYLQRKDKKPWLNPRNWEERR